MSVYRTIGPLVNKTRTKMQISCAVISELICVLFGFVKIRRLHEVAHVGSCNLKSQGKFLKLHIELEILEAIQKRN